LTKKTNVKTRLTPELNAVKLELAGRLAVDITYAIRKVIPIDSSILVQSTCKPYGNLELLRTFIPIIPV